MGCSREHFGAKRVLLIGFIFSSFIKLSTSQFNFGRTGSRWNQGRRSFFPQRSRSRFRNGPIGGQLPWLREVVEPSVQRTRISARDPQMSRSSTQMFGGSNFSPSRSNFRNEASLGAPRIRSDALARVLRQRNGAQFNSDVISVAQREAAFMDRFRTGARVPGGQPTLHTDVRNLQSSVLRRTTIPFRNNFRRMNTNDINRSILNARRSINTRSRSFPGNTRVGNVRPTVRQIPLRNPSSLSLVRSTSFGRSQLVTDRTRPRQRAPHVVIRRPDVTSNTARRIPVVVQPIAATGTRDRMMVHQIQRPQPGVQQLPTQSIQSASVVDVQGQAPVDHRPAQNAHTSSGFGRQRNQVQYITISHTGVPAVPQVPVAAIHKQHNAIKQHTVHQDKHQTHTLPIAPPINHPVIHHEAPVTAHKTPVSAHKTSVSVHKTPVVNTISTQKATLTIQQPGIKQSPHQTIHASHTNPSIVQDPIKTLNHPTHNSGHITSPVGKITSPVAVQTHNSGQVTSPVDVQTQTFHVPQHIQPTGGQGSVVSVHYRPAVPVPATQGGVATSSSQTVISQTQPVKQVPSTDPLFEELVTAFTEVLQNPSAAAAPTHHHSHIPVQHPLTHNHLQLGHYHPQTIQSRSQFGFNQGGFNYLPHEGHGNVFGNPFGYVNPWMMDPVARQEMMFGDTTDPPDPIVVATTVAPKTSVAIGNVTSTVHDVTLAVKPAIPLVSHPTMPSLSSLEPTFASATSGVPAMDILSSSEPTFASATGGVPAMEIHSSLEPTFASATSGVPAMDIKPTVNIIKSTAVQEPTTNINVIEPVPKPSNLTLEPFTHIIEKPPTEVTSVISKLTDTTTKVTEKAVKEIPKSIIPPGANTRILSELTGMLSNSKLDIKVVEGAIQQAAKVLGKLPPELEAIATQLGIIISPTAVQPTLAPVPMETIPTAEQLGVTHLEPGAVAPKESIAALIGSTRGIVVYPPTAPSVTIPVAAVGATGIKVVVIDPKANLGVSSNGQGNKQPVALNDNASPVDTTMTLNLHTLPPPAVVNNLNIHTLPPPAGVNHLDLPTLPPTGVGNHAEVYQTLKTITEHSPGAIAKVISDTPVHKPEVVERKLTVKSLVDVGTSGDLPTLKSILKNISEKQVVPVSPIANTVTDVNPVNPIVHIAELSTPGTLVTVPSTQDVAPLDGGKATGSISSPDVHTDVTKPAIYVSMLETSTVSTSPVQRKLTIHTFNPVLANAEGIPVNVRRIAHAPYVEETTTSAQEITSPTVPVTFSVERSPVHVDKTGALAILKEIQSFNSSNSTISTKSVELATKLSDPAFVDALKGLMRKFQTAFTTAKTTPIPETTTLNFADVTTTSLPVTSTGEYEAEDYIVTTLA